MHNGDRDGARTEQDRPANGSAAGSIGQLRATGTGTEPPAKRVREPESKRPWASRRANGPSWAADSVEPF
jgi:hypothetical protein